MTEVFQRGDVDAVLSHYTEDAAVAFEPGKPVSGAAALRAGFEAFAAVTPVFHCDRGHDVMISGDVAVHIAPWTMTGTPRRHRHHRTGLVRGDTAPPTRHHLEDRRRQPLRRPSAHRYGIAVRTRLTPVRFDCAGQPSAIGWLRQRRSVHVTDRGVRAAGTGCPSSRAPWRCGPSSGGGPRCRSRFG
ncbi:nuclear transport factor 2 family protein [Nocardia otitidiscaviarum]|nr:nuclear transport factor 2 family protein [Nocardia otitidiscaviarum]